jgi:hypothetical protein
MNTLEFSTKIEHGLIHLPFLDESYDNSYVRVIIILEKPDNQIHKKEKLLTAFQKMRNYTMFQSIANPVTWQKQLRDEWE